MIRIDEERLAQTYFASNECSQVMCLSVQVMSDERSLVIKVEVVPSPSVCKEMC